MRLFAVILSAILFFCQPAFSYPQDQFDNCISNAKNDPVVKYRSEINIENYCDCVLSLTVDQGERIRDSGYKCALKYFSNKKNE